MIFNIYVRVKVDFSNISGADWFGIKDIGVWWERGDIRNERFLVKKWEEEKNKVKLKKRIVLKCWGGDGREKKTNPDPSFTDWKNFFITKFILSDWMNFFFYSFNIPIINISFNFIIFLFIITLWLCYKEKHAMWHAKITALSFSQLKWTQEILSSFNCY